MAENIRDRLQHILEAPHAERDQLLRQFAEDLSPEFKSNILYWKRKGWFLWGGFEYALSSAIARDDLSEDEKMEALREACSVGAAIEVFGEAESSLVSRDLAFDLAMNMLFAGLRAGLSPDEIRKLEAHLKSERQREIGKKSGPKRKAKSERWKTHATDLAKAIRAKNSTLSQEDLAERITSKWGTSEFIPPGRRALVGHISSLEKSNELPQRAGKLRK